jgi:hypothetical protein
VRGREEGRSYIVKSTRLSSRIILLKEALYRSILDLLALCKMPIRKGRWRESEECRDGSELHDDRSIEA